jgi:hypothetical protein
METRIRAPPQWMIIMGIWGGIILIIGFFVELLVFNRWMPSLAISGVSFTSLFVYWHRRFYKRC